MEREFSRNKRFERAQQINRNRLSEMAGKEELLQEGTTEKFLLVYFNVQTTGDEEPRAIVQLAVGASDDDCWSVFVNPQRPVEPEATEHDEFTWDGKQLRKHGEPVATIPLQQCLYMLLGYLVSKQTRVVLVGHDTESYNALQNEMTHESMYKVFKPYVLGFINTYRMFAKERQDPKDQGYSLTALVAQYLPEEEYEEFNAEAHTLVLRRLVMQKFKEEELRKHIEKYEVAFNNTRLSDMAGKERTLQEVTIEEFLPVYFNVQTTGDVPRRRIVQLAVGASDDDCWSVFVDPEKPVEPETTDRDKFTWDGKQLGKRGEPVATIPLQQCLYMLLGYLVSRKTRVVLVGHDTESYNALQNEMRCESMYKVFKPYVLGFINTYRMFEKERQDLGDQGYSLTALVAQYLPEEEYEEFNAEAHTLVLRRLVMQKFKEEELRKHIEKYEVAFNNTRQSEMAGTEGPLQEETTEEFLPVYFNVQTTGDKERTKIVQIAVGVSEDDCWSVFVDPERPVDPKAAELNKFTWEEGQLRKHGEPVATIPLQQCLYMLLGYLVSRKKRVVLVGHHIQSYHVLQKEMTCEKMVQVFKTYVLGFLDTRRMFEKERPHLGVKGCSLRALVDKYVPQVYEKFNAEAHMRVLMHLVKQEFNKEELRKHIEEYGMALSNV